MFKFGVILLFLSFFSNGMADEIVTLTNGKKALLKDNGTWTYMVSPEKENTTYIDISLSDLKSDLSTLDKKKIKTQAFAEMYDFMLTIRQESSDKAPLSVNINSLSQQERDYLHQECLKGCNITLYGRVGDVMYDEKGVIADKIEW